MPKPLLLKDSYTLDAFALIKLHLTQYILPRITD
jgi:hypothetical protein